MEFTLFVRPANGTIAAALALVGCLVLSGCDKLAHQSAGEAKAETKREQAACASPTAYDRLKNSIFDEAIARRPADRPNLDTLADYSVARMEDPVVEGWDRSLDITRCKGRFILEVPPGAERGFGGVRQLQASIEYTAQASADGTGLVYQQKGAEDLVAKLAAFNLDAVAYRPPPAIDEEQAQSSASGPVPDREAQAPQHLPSAPAKQPARDVAQESEIRQPKTAENARVSQPALRGSTERPGSSQRAAGGEGAVRAFYAALSAGNGAAAASQVIPEKRSSGPFSAGAISRFYGHLREPLKLTSVTSAAGSYRVTYRYSAGRSHCNGVAVVHVTNHGGRDLISSIRSLSGC